MNVLLPLAYAFFIWWFSTGAIMAVYGRSRVYVRLWFVAATLISLAALAGLWWVRARGDEFAIYFSVTCGVVLWGWHTASFYLGFLSGPHPTLTAAQRGRLAHQPLMTRFWLGLRAVIHHQLAVLLCLAVMIALLAGQPNLWGLWMFVALWVMHSSAQLSVFFGVRNFRINFLPGHLHYLDALFEKNRNNGYLMTSVTIATSVGLYLLYRGINPIATPADRLGHLLVAAMVLLGVLESIILVLPLPAVLWGWGVRLLPQDTAKDESPLALLTVTPPNPTTRTAHLAVRVPVESVVESEG